MNRAQVEPFIKKRVIVKFLYDDVPRYFIAKIRKITETDEVIFAEEEWVDDKRGLGIDGEQLEVQVVMYIAGCPVSRQKEVIVGAML